MKKQERVPPRVTVNRKQRYGAHRTGSVPITIWEDAEFKAFLREEAAKVRLPKWTLSDHVSFLLRDYYDLWEKPYRPYPKKK